MASTEIARRSIGDPKFVPFAGVVVPIVRDGRTACNQHGQLSRISECAYSFENSAINVVAK